MTGERSQDGSARKMFQHWWEKKKREKKSEKKIVPLLLVLHSGGVIELPLSYLPSAQTEAMRSHVSISVSAAKIHQMCI